MNDLTWTSPSAAMDMVYDVREDGVGGLDLALLRPRAKGADNTLARLLGAKLQPMKPEPGSWTTPCGWPVTARDHRLVLAAGAPDPVSLTRLVGDYDAAVRPQQRLLAAVLTMRFEADQPVHEAMAAATAFATFRLARERRLTSVVVLHTPGVELAHAAAHSHIVVFARTHRQSGWGPVDADLTDQAHAKWADEWRSFLEIWNKLPPAS